MPLEGLSTWLGRLALVNFVAFGMFWQYYGGNAFNGHATGGEYFLGHDRHLTQVSATLFRVSWWWTVLLVIHFVVGIALELYQRRRTPEWFWEQFRRDHQT
jgi:hypothetical protein